MARLRWGMIGGGEGSQIGPAHRLGARLDGQFDFVAGALDIEPDRGRRFARSLGVPADRAYGDWREILEHMRAMVARGDLGEVRLIKAEFAHGFHADADDGDNARIRWRYDPAEAGISAVTTECGIHALHMACFVTGQTPTSVSADFGSVVPEHVLEDDSMLSLRFSGGAVGRLWTSAVAVGRMHGLTMQIFGTKGGLRWAQEWPNQLYWTPLNEPTQILERGAPGLSADAEKASRIAAGHAEGLPVAFANIYADLAEVLSARREGREPDSSASPARITSESASSRPSSVQIAWIRPNSVSSVPAKTLSWGTTDLSAISTISFWAVSRHQPFGWSRCSTSCAGVSLNMFGFGPGSKSS